MIFLGWERPLLHSAADWVLSSQNIPKAPDLSEVILVVRGRRAGRRLMELLALRCADTGLILLPPEIVTASSLVGRLTRGQEGEPERASSLACALAWAEAITGAERAHQERLFRRPGSSESAPGLGTLTALGRHLHQIWTDLGGAGLSFCDVKETLAERFPHIADLEIPRWDVLENLHRRAGEILERQGLIDPTDLLIKKARTGDLIADRSVVLLGVAEMPKVVAEFLGRLPRPPAALVFAPESEREGFDELGLIKPAYWAGRPMDINAGQIHAVERDRDQALRVARIVKGWQEAGVGLDQIAVAAPDDASLPRLREALELEQMEVRAAQGRPASGAPVLQLLRAVAAYLDHAPGEPPRYAAMAELVRMPDFPGVRSSLWPALDRYATDHLPARFDPRDVVEPSEAVHSLDAHLRQTIDVGAGEIAPREMAGWTLEFVGRIYGERQEDANSPEGRLAVQGISLLRDVLAETSAGRLPWPPKVRPADFLSVILSFLGEQRVPEPAFAGAIQVAGWLELIEDDSPAVVVTSFYEGAIPESVSSDPFLPGALRQALALADNAMRFARDAYALAAIAGSRAGGRGGVALVAPRFDAEENPVRPSRLLLAGLGGEALARRIWHLAGRRAAEPRLPREGGAGFNAAPVGPVPPMEQIRVTAFRQYLESPRKFYFQQVLELKAEHDSATELEPAGAGTLLHEALAAFGRDPIARGSRDEREIHDFVSARFKQIIRDRYGSWAQPAVEIQIEEVKRRLAGFARVQAELTRDGWEIRYVEGSSRLEADVATLRITGKIDRMDYHAGQQRWRIIDYKTSAKARQPEAEHRKRSGEWKDLQLPLYLKLAAPHAWEQWGTTLTPDNCELTYFLLPEEERSACISSPFPPGLIEVAWQKAAELAGNILRGEFEENPPLDTRRNEPALLALCGQIGIVSSESSPDLEEA
jgi:hypothetical protein